jgi:hypothetical protein
MYTGSGPVTLNLASTSQMRIDDLIWHHLSSLFLKRIHGWEIDFSRVSSHAASGRSPGLQNRQGQSEMVETVEDRVERWSPRTLASPRTPEERDGKGSKNDGKGSPRSERSSLGVPNPGREHAREALPTNGCSSMEVSIVPVPSEEVGRDSDTTCSLLHPNKKLESPLSTPTQPSLAPDSAESIEGSFSEATPTSLIISLTPNLL